MTHRHEAIAKPKLLLGEGKDELEFFEALLRHLKIDDVQPMKYEGKSRLRPVLETIIQMPDFHTVTSIGITRDADFPKSPADQAVDSAFKSICGTLRHANIALPVPTALMQKATRLDKPDITIFIMPDCENDGMLEDLCLESLADEIEMGCVDNYVKCLEKIRGNPIAEHKLPKARLNTWIASQDAPDLSLGIATQRRYINFRHPAFDQLKKFVLSL